MPSLFLALLCRRLSAITAVGSWPTCRSLPTLTPILWQWSWQSCASKSFSPETWSYGKERWGGKCTLFSMAPSLSSHVGARRLPSMMERTLEVNHSLSYSVSLPDQFIDQSIYIHIHTTNPCIFLQVKLTFCDRVQRSACWPKEDARPPWRLIPTAACTPWVWTVSTRSWRSILSWGGRLRAWPWTDWAAFLADPVISRHQLTNILKTQKKRHSRKDGGIFDTFCPEG